MKRVRVILFIFAALCICGQLTHNYLWNQIFTVKNVWADEEKRHAFLLRRVQIVEKGEDFVRVKKRVFHLTDESNIFDSRRRSISIDTLKIPSWVNLKYIVEGKRLIVLQIRVLNIPSKPE